MINGPLRNAVQDVVKYYDFFAYAPSLDEIYTFLPMRTSKKELQKNLKQMVLKKALEALSIENWSYTLPGHSIFARKKARNREISLQKIDQITRFIEIISSISPIKLIGYSGSVAMNHAQKNDDIDLFIVTAGGRIWTVRFLMILIAVLMGYKRRRAVAHDKDKVCMNLFFDERDLSIPLHKRNVYVGHEVLQMRPVIVRDDIYDRFLEANKWVYDFFPNAYLSSSRSRPSRRAGVAISSRWGLPRSVRSLAMTHTNVIEFILKHIQLFLINRHKTTELVTDTQLWFFPQDFEKKLRKSGLV